MGTSGKQWYNPYYSQYIKERTAKLMKEPERFIEVEPFENIPLPDVWYRADSEKDLPVVSVEAPKNIRRYGHFVFTFMGDICFIGVPGRFLPEDHPDNGDSGFGRWMPMKGYGEMDIRSLDKAGRENVYGYWLMAIEWKNGIITEIS